MMKAWEFLLQREGDHTWLPLETPTVEILEGRYRIVVRTPCPRETVDIHISYVSTEDDPPKRRVQQRSRQTNDDGLMAFLPFTSFRTGRWELRCRPHVEPGSFEQRWSATLQLQVLEQEAATTNDLFGWDLANADSVESHQVQASDDIPPAQTPVPEAAPTPEVPLTDSLPPSSVPLDANADIQQLAEQMSRMVVDSVLSAAEALPSETPPAETSPSKSLTSESLTSASLTPDPTAAASEGVSPAADPSPDPSQDIITPESLAADLGSPAATTAIPAPSPTGASNVPTSEAILTDAVPEESGITEAGMADAGVPPSGSNTDANNSPSLPASPLNIAIYLQQETLTLGSDRQVTLSGELQPNLAMSPERDLETAALPSLILTVELRDPSSTAVWENQQQTFPPQGIGAIPFHLALTVPTSCPSPLLLGTATLWENLVPERDDESGTPGMNALSSAQFTVMVSVEILLNRVNQTPDSSESSEPDITVQTLQHKAASNFVVTKMGMEPTVTRGNRQVNTDLLGLLGQSNTPETEAEPSSQRGFRPVAKQQLPPKLEPRSSDSQSQGSSLDLPSFGTSHNPVFQWIPPEEETAAETAQETAEAPPPNSDNQENQAPSETTANTEAATPQLEAPVPETSTTTSAPLDIVDNTAAAAEPTPDEFVIPEEATLEELAELFGTPAPDLGMPAVSKPTAPEAEITDNSQESSEPDKPTSRPEDPLGSATAWAAPATWVDNPVEVVEVHQANDESRETSNPEPAPTSAEPPPSDPLMNRMHELVVPQPSVPKESPALLTEIVVEDEDLPATRMAWMQPQASRTASPTDVAIDTPEMQIADGDLIVGDTIRITLRVPTEPPQLCARVWLLDCQSRTLLTEPQWVTAFLPLSDSQVEASIELKIPEGSIELQIEAIAVDPNSQRESRKVAIRRTVVLGNAADTPTEPDRFNPWMK